MRKKKPRFTLNICKREIIILDTIILGKVKLNS